jgi:hypothetical protein
MLTAFTPAEVELMAEIGAVPYFAHDITDEIAATAQQNAVTPAVVLAKLQAIQSQRSEYITHLTSLRDALKAVGIQENTLQPGSAELGVLLPRPLFHNELAGLISELSVLNQILRLFSEVITGTIEPVEIRQISTTDPIFGFGLSLGVIIAVGKTVTWALATWKTIEEIRKLRHETQKNDAFSEQEVRDFFDTKIEKSIEKAIKEKAVEMVPVTTSDVGRKQELHAGMEWALRSILTRIERGMTVEVRFLPPPAPKEGADPLPEEQVQQFSEINSIVPQLKFPATSDAPILALPPPEPPKGGD